MSIDDDLRAWAKGVPATEAGVELLLRIRPVQRSHPWVVTTEHGTTHVDPFDLVEHTGTWSGAEHRAARVAASLMDGEPVDLSEDVANLDRYLLTCVLAAIAHAAGSHEQSDVVVDEDGVSTGMQLLSRLVEWPEPRH